MGNQTVFSSEVTVTNLMSMPAIEFVCIYHHAVFELNVCNPDCVHPSLSLSLNSQVVL